MQYGLHIGNGSAVTDSAVLCDVAQLAEELGYESILIGDHVMPPRKINSPYPLPVETVPWNIYQEEDWPDCFAMLAFLAAATKKVRLGTSVIILPYRHPIVMAKMLATIDRLSGGRVICGVGIGWIEAEFDFLGAPFAERAVMSEEYIMVMKALWTQKKPRIDGRYITINQDVNFGPLPVQNPHPPIWVGGNTLPAMRRVARWGDGWQPVFLPLEVIQQKLEQLRSLVEKEGRDFYRLEISTLVGANTSLEEAKAYQATGFHLLYTGFSSNKPQKMFAEMKQFAGTLREAG